MSFFTIHKSWSGMLRSPYRCSSTLMQLDRTMPTYMLWLLCSSREQPCARPSAQCLMARQHLHNWLGHAAAAELRRALSSRGRVVADANLQGLESHDERRMYFNLCL